MNKIETTVYENNTAPTTVIAEGLNLVSNSQNTPGISTTVQTLPPVVTNSGSSTQSVTTQIQQVPQIQTSMTKLDIPISSVVNAPFVQVTSVNGRTGDVQVDSVIDTFTPGKYYAKGQSMIHNGTIYVAKKNLTTGDAISDNDWHKTVAAPPPPQNLSISGNSLSIERGNTVKLPNTPPQQLSISGYDLSISSGNTISLPQPAETPTATTTNDGLMSSSDKAKLDGVQDLIDTAKQQALQHSDSQAVALQQRIDVAHTSSGAIKPGSVTQTMLSPQAREDYSTNEVNTGRRWVDGRTVYQKVIKGTINIQQNTNIYYAHGISGLTRGFEIISCTGSIILGGRMDNSNGKSLIPHIEDNHQLGLPQVTLSHLRFVASYPWGSSDFTIVLRYVK